MTTVDNNADSAKAVPETELACVVLHAGEMSDINYLKDYIQVILRTFLSRISIRQQAERDTVMAVLSVCLSVCLCPGLYYV